MQHLIDITCVGDTRRRLLDPETMREYAGGLVFDDCEVHWDRSAPPMVTEEEVQAC